jgi:hypothetical protein
MNVQTYFYNVLSDHQQHQQQQQQQQQRQPYSLVSILPSSFFSSLCNYIHICLQGMGFDRDTVVAALSSSGNSIQIAADRLLGS